jgi:hypothetical protein
VPAKKSKDAFNVTGRVQTAKHKFRNLRGRTACRYCDKLFATKIEKNEHNGVCEYLQCDPKNFICRVCGKELSKKTFSNHVHEALECQFCSKKILNPRNMKFHIEKKHKGEKKPANKSESSLRKKEMEEYLKEKENEEAQILARLKEIPKSSSSSKNKGDGSKSSTRFECDVSAKSLFFFFLIKKFNNLIFNFSFVESIWCRCEICVCT